MIAFASCVGSEERYRQVALPALERVCEDDSVIAEVTTDRSIFEAYNEVLDAFRGHEGLEALVLLHEDVEIVDSDFLGKVRRRLAEPGVAVLGVVGALGVTSLAWWLGEGRGRCLDESQLVDFGGGRHDVESVDGLLLVLSPWAVDNLRFDSERFTGFHGYDADICFQARAAGKRVVVDEIAVVHRSKATYGNGEAFVASNEAFREKWGFGTGRAPKISA